MESKIEIQCDCGCAILKFEREFFNKESEIYISQYASSFCDKQGGIWYTLKRRISMAWHMLIGKEYRLYDLILIGDEVKNFEEQMRGFVNNNDNRQ